MLTGLVCLVLVVNIWWHQADNFSVLEGSRSSSPGALPVLMAVFTVGGQSMEGKWVTSVNRNWIFFFWVILYPVCRLLDQVIHRAQTSTYSKGHWSQQVTDGRFKGQPVQPVTPFILMKPRRFFLFLFFYHQTYWMTVPLSFICGGVC